uniref:Transmembrane protein 230 n=1 Tax=Scleropages formosus TaxID=113540 RepID=A0A8C9T4A0_SCLFO
AAESFFVTRLLTSPAAVCRPVKLSLSLTHIHSNSILSSSTAVRFKKSPPKVPYKAIALAAVLFLIGSVLIIIGALLLTGYIEVSHPDRTIPVLIIGILVFLPGFYHLRIAYYAWRGYHGYSYEDIPDFDD